jgi:hypothetical protein
VQPAAPPLGTANGLDEAIAFASARAPTWLFFRVMTALLMVSKSLYCRPTALLRLRRRDISYMPPSASAQGGLVLSLLLPKKRKDRVDLRLDSHPIPMGPTVLALLGLLEALGLLTPEAPLDGAVFPDVDTNTDAIRHPFMTVNRSTDVLRQQVFIPAGIPNGARLTLRSIRSGSSTDAAISGVSDKDRLAQGGWKSAAGAATYLDRAFALLSQKPPAGDE